MSHAIQSSIDDSTIQQQRKRQPLSTVRAAESKDRHSKEAASNGDHPDYEHPYIKHHNHLWHDTDNEIIALLSSERQHQWIDLQYRGHCIQSQSKCTQAAANLGNSPFKTIGADT
jgi:hypothetical protein